jgi:hypothetical protein
VSTVSASKSVTLASLVCGLIRILSVSRPRLAEHDVTFLDYRYRYPDLTLIMMYSKLFTTTFMTLVITLQQLQDSAAFTSPLSGRESSSSTSSLQASRRAFLDASVTTAAGLALFTTGAPAAFADDDLAMPDEEEQKKLDVSE